MNRNYTYGGRKKTREKLVIAAVCGPVFAAALLIGMFLATLLDRHGDSARYIIWPVAGAGCAGLAAAADRFGKHLGLTPQEFAGPVALSFTLSALAAYALLWTLFGGIHS